MKKFLIFLAFVGFFAFAPHAFAAGCTGTGNCYWVGGTGNWSDTTKWATTDGGATTGGLPSATDTCNFTANSSTANAAYTVTVDTAATCLNFVMAGPGAGNKVTMAFGAAAISIAGNINLSGGTAGITWSYAQQISMIATTGTKTITSNGIILLGTLGLNGIGGTFQLADALNIGGTGSFTLSNGAFDANNQTVTLSGSTQSITPTQSLTFFNLTRTPSSPVKTNTLTLQGNITVSNLFTVSDGATITNRVLVQSSVVGTSRTITAASVSISNADFMDIIGAGAASWDLSAASGGSGDCGGNTLQALGTGAFTSATTSYWAASYGGNWSGTGTTLNWTPTQGGATSTNPGRVPLCQDNVSMNLAFGTSKTVTADMPRLGGSIDWTGATWTTALTWTNSVAYSVNGSLTLISNLTLSGANVLTFIGRGGFSFNSFGINQLGSINVTAPNGTVTLKSNLNFSVASLKLLTINNGNFDAQDTNNNWNVSSNGIGTGNSGLRVITMGNGTWTMNGAGSFAMNGTNLTVNANGSTIKYTDTTNSSVTFTGFGFTYNNLWFSRGASTGSITISGSNTFNNFRDDGSAAHSILFTAGTTQTISSWSVSGISGNLITLDSNTTAAYTLKSSSRNTLFCSNFLSVQHSIAQPAKFWYAGGNSTNNQNTATAGSGWLFRNCSQGYLGGGSTTIRGGNTTFKGH